ncbi:MAG TPA: CHAT domain-containing protein [Longimicrobium sp.]|jgi:Tfp pilus assembly protein PilF
MTEKEEAVASFLAATQTWLGGDLRGALDQLARAEALAREAGDAGLLATILVQKPAWLREAGRAGEARAALQAVEAGIDAVPPEVRGMVLAALRMEQGIVATQAGEFAAAERHLREAERMTEGERWAPVLLSDILANLAALYLEQGKLEAARETLARAIDLDRRTGNVRALSNDLNLLALVYQTSGDLETADAYLREALAEAEKGGFLKEAADALSNLAVQLDEKGQVELARAGFESVLSLYRRIGNQDAIASTLSSLGVVAAKRGDHAEARRLHQEAQALHRQVGNAAYALRGDLNLAQTELSRGDARAALARASKVVDEAEALGLVELLWRGLWLKARARAATVRGAADASEAARALNDEVLPAYAQAAEAVELLRTGIGRPEEREQLLWNKEDLYAEGLLLSATLSQRWNAFYFSERARARAFLDALGAERLQRSVAGDPLLERREQLARELTGLRDGDRERARPLLQELRRLRAEIRSAGPRAAAVTDTLPGHDALFRAIPPKTAVVEFFAGPGDHLAVFVLTSEGMPALTVNRLGRFDLGDLVERFRTELTTRVEGVPTGEVLFHLLFGPVWDVLRPMERLLIVPHGALHYVSFGATWFRPAGEGPQRVYLAESAALSVLPSAAFLPVCLGLARPALRKGAARVLGNPTRDLPGAELEAVGVAARLGVAPLLGSRATRAALLDAPPDLAVVHVASHGVYDPLDPLLSGVEMADGRVTAEDLMESRISAGLLTLSGCVTGLAKRYPGDELAGLTRAAAAAGIPSVVTSLWPVEDQSAREFFAQFYQALSQGHPKDLSMRLAQRALQEDPEFGHPGFWAPFVLFGDWR